MKKLLLIAVMAVMATNVMAQRSMDKLDRGLIAIKTDAGVFCSWRILEKNTMTSLTTSIVTERN